MVSRAVVPEGHHWPCGWYRDASPTRTCSYLGTVAGLLPTECPPKSFVRRHRLSPSPPRPRLVLFTGEGCADLGLSCFQHLVSLVCLFIDMFLLVSERGRVREKHQC